MASYTYYKFMFKGRRHTPREFFDAMDRVYHFPRQVMDFTDEEDGTENDGVSNSAEEVLID